MDAITWKSDIPRSTPNHHIRTVTEAVGPAFTYSLRGGSGRWFVQRLHRRSGTTERTPFYDSQRAATEIFEQLTGG